MSKLLAQFKEGLFTNNPVLVQLIGMCPTLATSTSLKNGIGMGLAATAVLICSNIAISALRKIIPNKIRIACFIVVIAGFVTVVDLLLQAYLPDLSNSLGVFIPLIVVNCIILARAEAYASKNGVLPSAIDGLTMGLGFTFALCLLSTIREILGAGTIYGLPVFGDHFQPAMMLAMPAGGFLTLGCLIAAFQVVMKKMKKKGA
ncbi:MAG: electron transport complex subunit E [Clostridiaceae bacterium]|nr:electron transport complex subunit E [Clostridiaceae bacterium]